MSDTSKLEQAAKEAAAEIVHEFGVADENTREAYQSLSARIIYEHFAPIFAEQLTQSVNKLEAEAAALRQAMEKIDKHVIGTLAQECPECDPSVGHKCPSCTAKDDWIPKALSGSAGQSLLAERDAYREWIEKAKGVLNNVLVKIDSGNWGRVQFSPTEVAVMTALLAAAPANADGEGEAVKMYRLVLEEDQLLTVIVAVKMLYEVIDNHSHPLDIKKLEEITKLRELLSLRYDRPEDFTLPGGKEKP